MIGLFVKVMLVFSTLFGSAGGVVALSADRMAESQNQEMLVWMEQAMGMSDGGAGRLLRPRDRVSEAQGEAARLMRQLRKTEEDGLNEPLQYRHGRDLDSFELAFLQRIAIQKRESERPGSNGPGEGKECEPSGDQNRYGGSCSSGPQGPCEGEDCQSPGDQNQYGEPGPNGPQGPCEGEDCQSPGDQNQYGEPGPNGPQGPCEGEDCQSPGDQNQYGEPGPNGPQGPCEVEDCQPAGDQNQNGPGEQGDNPAAAPDPNPAPEENEPNRDAGQGDSHRP